MKEFVVKSDTKDWTTPEEGVIEIYCSAAR